MTGLTEKFKEIKLSYNDFKGYVELPIKFKKISKKSQCTN